MKLGPIEGVVVKDLVRYPDERGFFEEILRASDDSFTEFGQFSWCRRKAGTVTAWHVHPHQRDWWFVVHGVAKAVLHDLREESPTRANTLEIYLGDGANDRLLVIPSGVAHGYKVVDGPMELFYVTSREYNREHPAPPEGEEGRIPHNDPSIGYDWYAVETAHRTPGAMAQGAS